MKILSKDTRLLSDDTPARTPAVGDPITILFLAPVSLLPTAVVDAYEHLGVFRVRGGSVYDVDEENTRWIRGHHAEDSDEGKALLAAFALVFG